MRVLRCYSHTPPSPPSPLPVLVQLHPSTTSSTKCYSWIGFSDVPDSGSWQGRGYECLLNTQVLMNTQVGLVFIKTDEYSSSRYSLREYFQDLGIHIQVFSIHGTHEQTGSPHLGLMKDSSNGLWRTQKDFKPFPEPMRGWCLAPVAAGGAG